MLGTRPQLDAWPPGLPALRDSGQNLEQARDQAQARVRGLAVSGGRISTEGPEKTSPSCL